MRWFGPTDKAPFFVLDYERTATPVGSSCEWCREPIVDSDFGVLMNCVTGPYPLHWECEARQMIGSLAHIERRCSCYVPGSICTDPPELSRREAARRAITAFRRQWKLQT